VFVIKGVVVTDQLQLTDEALPVHAAPTGYAKTK
jgi:hypothetical protein